MADDVAQVRIEAQTDGAESDIRRFTSTLTSGFDTMRAKLDELVGGFDALKIGIAGIVTALGAEFIGTAAEKFTDITLETKKLAAQLGETTEYTSVLRVALEDIGSSSEVYIGAMMKLNMHLKAHGDALKQLVPTTDAVTGAQLSQQQVMQNALSKMESYKEGWDRNQFALYAFGRGAAEVTPLLRLNAEVMEEARQKAEAFGLIIGSDNVSAARAFKTAMATLHGVVDGLWVTLGRELTPVLTELVNFLANAGGPIIEWFGNVLKVVAIAALAFKSAVVEAILAVNVVLGPLTETLLGASKSLMQLLAGDYSGALQTVKQIPNEISRNFRESIDQMKQELVDFGVTADRIASGPTAKPPPKKKDGDDWVAPPKVKPEKDRLSQWKADLEETHEKQASILAKSLDDDEVYWEKRKKEAQGNAKELIGVEHELYQIHREQAQEGYQAAKSALDLQLADARNNYSERIVLLQQEAGLAKATYGDRSTQYAAALKAIEVEEAKHKEEIRKIQVQTEAQSVEHQARMLDIERDRVSYEYDLGQISGEQKIAALLELENRLYAIKMQELQDNLALYRADEQGYRDSLKNIEKLNDEHQRTLVKFDQDAGRERLADWQQVVGTMSSSFHTAVQGWLQGTQTFQQGFHKIMQGVLANFSSIILETVEKWVVGEIMKTNVTSIQSSIRSMLGMGEAKSVVGAKGTEATGVVMANAAEAATGAAASQASIPWIGPEMAVAAAAAMFALSMGYLSSLPSAAGGWDIPSDSLAMLHKREMVLPVGLADRIRGMTGDSSSGDVHVHYAPQVNAIDAGGVHSVLMRHSKSVADAVRKELRNSNMT